VAVDWRQLALIGITVRRDKTSMIALRAHPLVMKTRGIVLHGLDFDKGRAAEHGTPLRLSMFDPMVDSLSITEGKDVLYFQYDFGCGGDLNHRPLGYEPTGNRNYNLQDAGGPRKTL
jgi:hypothetical protein